MIHDVDRRQKHYLLEAELFVPGEQQQALKVFRTDCM